MLSNSEKNWATLLHLSTLIQYCFPLGNFVLPIVIWISKKEESSFVDTNGKQCLNFQLSIVLYSLILAAIFIPTFMITFFNHITWNELVHNENYVLQDVNIAENMELLTTGAVALLLLIGLKIVEFFLIIQASIKTANGELYAYPLTIKFLK